MLYVSGIEDYTQGHQSANYPCYTYVLEDVLYVPSISWRMRDALKHGDTIPVDRLKAFQRTQDVFLHASWIYADGSQSQNGTGAAAVLEHNVSSCKLQEPSSALEAEMMAIHLAIALISTQPSGSFVIATDSMASLTALENNMVSTNTSALLMRCRSGLHTLATSGHSVTLVWVPAHSGITGNEIADEAAKRAATTSSLTTFKPEWHSYIGATKQALMVAWQHQWDTATVGRYCHSIAPRVALTPWHDKFQGGSLSRAALRTADRIAAKHHSLRKHHHQGQPIGSRQCICGEQETVDHVIFSCPYKRTFRRQLISHLRQNKHSEPFQINDILRTSNSASTIHNIHNSLDANHTYI